jgi:single-stranded-DNA-specific exonuclease
VMSISPEGLCKGSARSIPKFHLADVIHAHPELVSGGGHAMAAGCSFPLDKMADVIQAFDVYASERLSPDDFVPVICPDAVVSAEEVTRKAVEELCRMEPFGCANPTPVLAAQGMTLAEVAPTKKPEHVRTLLRSSETTVSAMGFNMGARITAKMIGQKVDVLFQPKLDEWRGTVTLKWHLQDLRETSPFETELEPELSGSGVRA